MVINIKHCDIQEPPECKAIAYTRERKLKTNT